MVDAASSAAGTDPREADTRAAAGVTAGQTLLAAAGLMQGDPRLIGSVVHIPAEGRLVMTGDLHDHQANLEAILRLADLDAAPDHRVLLHEVIHPALAEGQPDLSVRTLVRVAALRVAYPNQVLTVLSNHELAQINQEPIEKAGRAVCVAFEEGVHQLYGEAAPEVLEAVRVYVRAMPLAVRVAGDAGTLLLSHSVPGPKRIETFDKAVLNRRPTLDDLAVGGSASDMVWGRYHNRKILLELAEAWGVDGFVCGHQPAEAGVEWIPPNLLVLESDHDQGTALPLDLTELNAAPPEVHRWVDQAVRLRA